MRNPALPKLLNSIAKGTAFEELKVIFEQAAVELEKLEKIYKLIELQYPVNFSVELDRILNVN